MTIVTECATVVKRDFPAFALRYLLVHVHTLIERPALGHGLPAPLASPATALPNLRPDSSYSVFLRASLERSCGQSSVPTVAVRRAKDTDYLPVNSFNPARVAGVHSIP